MKSVFSSSMVRNPLHSGRMASGPWLVLDWCATGVTLAEALLENGRPILRTSRFMEWPSGLDPLIQPDDAGARLKRQCSEHGIRTGNVLLLLPRNLVQIRLLRFPPVSDSELEKLVALQMESRSAANGEVPAWDLLIHPAEGSAERFVTVLTIPQKSLDALLKSTRNAGFAISAVTCGDLCLSYLARTSDMSIVTEDALTQFFVLLNRSKLEVQVVRNSLPVASATMSVDPLEINDIVRTTHHVVSLAQRLNAGLPESWQTEQVRNFHVAGRGSESLVASLQRMGYQSVSFNCNERESRILGAVAALKHEQWLMDPVNPLRERLRKATIRSRIRMVAAAMGLMIAGAVYVQSVMADSAADVARLQAQRNQLADYVERGQDVVRTVASIKRWNSETRDCSLELTEILKCVDDPDEMILTRVQMEHQANGKTPVIRLDGLVRTSDVLHGLNEALMTSPNVQAIRPLGIEPAPEDAALPIQFRLELELAEKDGMLP